MDSIALVAGYLVIILLVLVFLLLWGLKIYERNSYRDGATLVRRLKSVDTVVAVEYLINILENRKVELKKKKKPNGGK